MQNQYISTSLIGKLREFPTLEGSDSCEIGMQQPLQLSIVSQFYPPDYAATGQLLAELATQLKHLGIDVQVFTGQPGYAFDKASAPRKEKNQGVKIRRSCISRLWPRRIRGRVFNGLLFCLRATLHLLKKVNQGDILLVTTEPAYLPIFGYLANLILGIPYICLLYDIYPDVAVELNVISPQNCLVRFWNWLNCQVWKHAKAVIVLSSTMKEQVASKCPEVRDKITVIHSWADPQQIKPITKDKNWFAQQFNLVDKFTVLYSGNMGRCHDMETILSAAKELQHEPIQFVFIGDGAKRQPAMDKVQQLGLDNCLFLPYQDKSVLPYSLTACDLSLVSIDTGMEGLVAPSKLYGILAAGRSVAVVCESHSYLRKLIAEAKCGATFNNGDAMGLATFIRHLASNVHVANTQGKAGRNYLQAKFTPEIIARQYCRILNKVRCT